MHLLTTDTGNGIHQDRDWLLQVSCCDSRCSSYDRDDWTAEPSRGSPGTGANDGGDLVADSLEQESGLQALVGTEILVSRDHPTAHVEVMAAANPRDFMNLLVGAITMTGPDGGPATKTYASIDGGQSWHASSFLEQRRWGEADLQVAFTPSGAALFSTLTTAQEEEGPTWRGPVEAANGGGELGINATTPMVLGDGTLVVPYSDFEFLPERRQPGQPSSLWIVASSDGGVTFSEPQLVSTRRFKDERGYGGHPQLTADAGSGLFQDFLYATWVDHEGPDPLIFVSRSHDRGETWSEPQAVDPDTPDGSYQFQPAIAVNTQGFVGLTWFDTRDQGDHDTFRQMFSASTDGGATWLSPVQVSSTPSYRYAPGNLGFTPVAMKTSEDSLRVLFLSPAARWSAGGDYMGLAADPEGRFRPFWTDTRYGSDQIMTTTVDVLVDPPVAETVATEEMDLTAAVEVIFDPSRYEADTETLSLLVRIRNVSQREIQGELSIVVRGFGSGQGSELREFAPAILNATNGLTGVGAEIDFSGAMGSSRRLLPGEISSPVELRFRLQDPLKTPDMHVLVRGRVVEGGGF